MRLNLLGAALTVLMLNACAGAASMPDPNATTEAIRLLAGTFYVGHVGSQHQVVQFKKVGDELLATVCSDDGSNLERLGKCVRGYGMHYEPNRVVAVTKSGGELKLSFTLHFGTNYLTISKPDHMDVYGVSYDNRYTWTGTMDRKAG